MSLFKAVNLKQKEINMAVAGEMLTCVFHVEGHFVKQSLSLQICLSVLTERWKLYIGIEHFQGSVITDHFSESEKPTVGLTSEECLKVQYIGSLSTD